MHYLLFKYNPGTMSYYRKMKYKARSRVSEVLEALGQAGALTSTEIQIWEDYRSIGHSPDAVIERAAAIEAFEEIKPKYPSANLTSMGISVLRDCTDTYQVDPFWTPGLDSRKVDSEGLIRANKEFLALWDEKRKKKKKELQDNLTEIDELMAGVKQIIDNANDSEQMAIVQEVAVIATVLENEGYTVSDESNNVSASDIAEKGAEIIARNERGDEVEVTWVNGELYLHLESTSHDGNCQREEERLSRLIRSGIEKQYEDDPIGGLTFEVESNGLGRGDQPKLKEADYDVFAQQPHDNPDDNTLNH